MPDLSNGEIQLIDMGVTLVIQDVPKLITFFKSLGSSGDLPAQQVHDALQHASDVDDEVIAAAKAALAGQ